MLVLLDRTRSHIDRATIRHPLPKLEEVVDAFSHTGGDNIVIPHWNLGIDANNVGGCRPHGETHRESDQQSLMTRQCTEYVYDIATTCRPGQGGNPLQAGSTVPVQCTTCLNPGHSLLECTLWNHCPICHSRPHTLELCEYNLLNRNTTPVRQIKPQSARAKTSNRQTYRESDRPRSHDQSWDDDRD